MKVKYTKKIMNNSLRGGSSAAAAVGYAHASAEVCTLLTVNYN